MAASRSSTGANVSFWTMRTLCISRGNAAPPKNFTCPSISKTPFMTWYEIIKRGLLTIESGKEPSCEPFLDARPTRTKNYGSSLLAKGLVP